MTYNFSQRRGHHKVNRQEKQPKEEGRQEAQEKDGGRQW